MRPYEPRAYTDAPRAQCGWALDTDWPVLPGNREAEVAIIGAGYTGLNAALTLAEAGVDVVVLEAQAPGWGASGRNGGFCCLGGSLLDPEGLTKRFGDAAGRGFVAAERAAIAHVADRIDHHDIDAQRHSDGEVMLAHRPRHARGFADEAKTLASHGIATEVLGKPDLERLGLGGPGFFGGLHIKEGFALDAGAYAVGIAHAARAAGAKIFAQSPVTGIAKDAAHHVLTTPRGTVRAKHMILATNGYSADDVPRWLRGRFLPVQSNVLMTRPLTADEQAAQGWTSDLMAYDTRNLLHYFRLMPDGRFLFGMRGGISATVSAEARATARMKRHFAHMFPAWRDIETPHTWSGFVNFSPNLTPYLGPIDEDPTALAAMAYHGNGVAMGSFAGHLAARLILGEDKRPEVMRKPLGRFPIPPLRRNLLRLSYPFATLFDLI